MFSKVRIATAPIHLLEFATLHFLEHSWLDYIDDAHVKCMCLLIIIETSGAWKERCYIAGVSIGELFLSCG